MRSKRLDSQHLSGDDWALNLKKVLMERWYIKMKYFPENYYLIVVGFFVSFNAFATKIAPVSIEELVSDSSMISVVDVKQANLSTEQYEVIYSGKKKNYLNYVATIIDPIKEGEKGKTVKFLGREPLLVSQKYLIFLIT